MFIHFVPSAQLLPCPDFPSDAWCNYVKFRHSQAKIKRGAVLRRLGLFIRMFAHDPAAADPPLQESAASNRNGKSTG